MIDKISLKNFKAFKDAEVEIKPITILVGPNNGGKSSFIQSIILIQQTLKGSSNEVLSLKGPLLNLGDFEGVVNQNAKEKGMGFKIDFDDRTYIDFTIAMGKDKLMFVKKFACNNGRFEYILEDLDDLYRPKKFELYSPIFEKYSFPISSFFEPVFYGDTFFLKFRSIGDLSRLFKKIYYYYKRPGEWEWLKEEEYPSKLGIGSRIGFRIRIKILKLIGVLSDLFKIKKTYDKFMEREKTDEEIEELSITDEEIEELNKKLLEFSYELPLISNDFDDQIKTEFNNIYYIGPLREKGHKIYDFGLYDYVGPAGEHAVQMIAANPGLEKETQTYLQNLEIVDGLQISKKEKLKIIEVKFNTKISKEVFLTELGCGTSQILPIIVQSLYSKDESMTIIEQPEVHLHPKAEAELAELFIQIANQKKRFLIETHSDYFVERIRMGIMRGKEEKEGISHEDVAIYYMEQNEKEKSSTVTKIEINDIGQYSKLPDGYLTNIRLEEVETQTDLMLKSLRKRKK